MFCKQCGKQVADTERFCPNCGATLPVQAVPQANPNYNYPPRPQGAPRPAAPRAMSSGDGLTIGSFHATIPQLVTCLAALVSLLAFIAYLSMPFGRTDDGAFSAVSVGALCEAFDYPSVFYIFGAIFMGLSFAILAADLVFSIIKKDGDNYNAPLFSIALHLIAFVIYFITAITLGGKIKDFKYHATFPHIMFYILSLVLVGYAVLATLSSMKKNGKFTLSIFGIQIIK